MVRSTGSIMRTSRTHSANGSGHNAGCSGEFKHVKMTCVKPPPMWSTVMHNGVSSSASTDVHACVTPVFEVKALQAFHSNERLTTNPHECLCSTAALWWASLLYCYLRYLRYKTVT